MLILNLILMFTIFDPSGIPSIKSWNPHGPKPMPSTFSTWIDFRMKTPKAAATELKKKGIQNRIYEWKILNSGNFWLLSVMQTFQGYYLQEKVTSVVSLKSSTHLRVVWLHHRKAHSSLNLDQQKESFFQKLQQNKGLSSCKSTKVGKNLLMLELNSTRQKKKKRTWFHHPRWDYHLYPRTPSLVYEPKHILGYLHHLCAARFP